MAKLSRVFLDRWFMPESEDPVLNVKTLVAGKGRTKPGVGGSTKPNPDVKLTDLELEDDPQARRVWVVCPGHPRRFVPYEWVVRGEEAEEPKPQPIGKNRK